VVLLYFITYNFYFCLVFLRSIPPQQKLQHREYTNPGRTVHLFARASDALCKIHSVSPYIDSAAETPGDLSVQKAAYASLSHDDRVWLRNMARPLITSLGIRVRQFACSPVHLLGLGLHPCFHPYLSGKYLNAAETPNLDAVFEEALVGRVRDKLLERRLLTNPRDKLPESHPHTPQRSDCTRPTGGIHPSG